VDTDGRNAFERWYYSLDENVPARVLSALDRLRLGSLPAKSVGGGVSEIRLHFGLAIGCTSGRMLRTW
jgi:putative component of toxin-antitoxin plasmid stabilization module